MFEGLGSIYWHMVSKLLLTVQECYEAAVEPTGGADAETAGALADAYDHLRDGLGFRKTATAQGAFPCDPYSHTPLHRGAQQPGMTGAVKEEVLARWGELGVGVRLGRLRFAPSLLHLTEFAANTLAFTYCATPVCYELADEASVLIHRAAGGVEKVAGAELSVAATEAIFARDGSIARLTVRVPRRGFQLDAPDRLRVFTA
jgi:hypothetical protein